MTEKDQTIEHLSSEDQVQPSAKSSSSTALPNQYYNLNPSPVYAIDNGKAEMRKTGTKICLLLILVTVIANVIQFIMVIPFSFKAALEHKPMTFMNDPLFQQMILYIPTLLSIFAVILIGRKVLNQKVLENYKVPQTDAKFAAAGCLTCIGAGSFALIFANLLVALFSLFGIKSGMTNLAAPDNLLAKIINISYICMIGPIIEETLFRGLILKSLRRFGNVFALVASSVLFGIFHFNLIQLIPTIAIGMVLAYIAIKSESIIPCILAHAANNIFNVLLPIIFAKQTSQQMIIYGVILAVTIILALVIIIHNRKEFKSIKSETGTEMTGKQKCGYFFFHAWGFYILLVFFVISCIIYSLSSSGLITKVG